MHRGRTCITPGCAQGDETMAVDATIAGALPLPHFGWRGALGASSGWGPGLGEVGEVGDTDIHTAEIAAYLIRCPRSKPPQSVCAWLSRGVLWGGLERAGDSASGWRRGGLHWSLRRRRGWAGLSLFSPTCHGDDVADGYGMERSAKRNSGDQPRMETVWRASVRTAVAAERAILRRWPSPKGLGKSHTAQYSDERGVRVARVGCPVQERAVQGTMRCQSIP